jgi:hypothetical protein
VSHRLLRDGGHDLVLGNDDKGDRQDGVKVLHRPASAAGWTHGGWHWLGERTLTGVQQQHREDAVMKRTSREQHKPFEAVPPTPIFNTTAITPKPWSGSSSKGKDKQIRK